MRIKNRWAIPLAILLLSACSNQTAKTAVKKLLNDPDSAQFSEMRAGKDTGDVCGYVNAKNRMGGFVGNTPFFYQQSTDTVAIVKSPEDSDFRMLWLDLRSGGKNDFVKIATQCDLVTQWESVCGSAYPMQKHEMCNVIHQPSELYKALKAVNG
ncbi:hypothetical protein G7048_19375 [Diaphorobacter sp. HDW4B]|uniref:hypothetical protein n=1 Tax=Diaphorobacter sp. HDW4B TaxID=2714925 RepID=UPI00140A5C4A|nr:hypothetical protein [Diaphorobacter sp. HDW4B]QIL72325.1 hypothetical protein G7048_19375 [Diaphorobacter sp. HDW4B]